MDKLTFKIEEFEGPLDLLLFLIQKHKLDIRDIQITQLLEQYLAYLEAAQRADLEVASEFLEMASRLVYLKTVMLLPRRREEGQQLKQELQGQLLEYQVCKLMAAQLAGRDRGELVFVSRKDYQIKHMGHRIELQEIEVVAAMHPEVAQACAVYDGEKDHIRLYYTGGTESAALTAFLKEKLPRYMLPNRMEQLERMPLTPNGKVDRKALAGA